MKDKYHKTKEHYNAIYEKYAQNSGIIMHDAIDLFLKHANKNGMILDIGCGPGHDVQYMIGQGYAAAGVDFSENMIEYARKNHKGSFYCLDVCADDFFANVGSINDVWMSAMLMHLSDNDQIELLEKINSNIASDGVVGLIVPFKLPERKKGMNKRPDILFHTYTKEALYKLLEDAGFRPISFSTFQFNNVEWGVVIANKKIV
jgi:SAM-dependent methyltransferase